MGIKIYEQSKQITVGITLRKAEGKDNHYMAVHENVKNEDIIHNRKNLAHMINLDLTDFTCATQTHGVTSYKVTDKNRGQGALVKDTALYDVDGLYTYERELVLCTF